MASQIQIDIGSGYGTAGAHADLTAAGGTVICRLTEPAGLSSIEWEISGTHSSAASKPAIALSGTPIGEIATFAVPAGAGQAYGIRARVREVSGRSYPILTAVYVPYANGEFPVFISESFERNATHGRIGTMNSTIANLP